MNESTTLSLKVVKTYFKLQLWPKYNKAWCKCSNAYSSGALYGTNPKVKFVALITKIKLTWNNVSGTNTLAFCLSVSVSYVMFCNIDATGLYYKHITANTWQ